MDQLQRRDAQQSPARLAPTAEPVDGTVEVDRVPADGCDDQVEPGGALGQGAIGDATPLWANTAWARASGLALVEPGGSAGAARGSPASRGEERAAEPPDCRGPGRGGSGACRRRASCRRGQRGSCWTEAARRIRSSQPSRMTSVLIGSARIGASAEAEVRSRVPSRRSRRSRMRARTGSRADGRGRRRDRWPRQCR